VGAVKVAAPRIRGECLAVPLLDRIRRIGKDHIKTHEVVALHKFRLGKGVPSDNLEILDAMKKAVHAGNGGGHEIALLPEKFDVAPFLTLAAKMGDAGKKHPARAACGVVDGFFGLRFEHLGHEMNHGAIGIELGGGVARIVGEFLDQELVALSKLIFRQVGDREVESAKMLDEISKHGV